MAALTPDDPTTPALDDPDRPEPGYLHAVLCQLGLPRSRPGGLEMARTSGQASLLLTAGKLWDGGQWVQQGLPYGTRARLALIHITSRAVLTRSPLVDIGHSSREFLRRLGMHLGGQEHNAFQKQMRALAACQMRIGIGHDTIMQAQPIKRFNALSNGPEMQTSLWPGHVILTDDFFQSLKEFAVPLDMNAVASLSNSTMALDCYTWLSHRLCRVTQPTGQRVSWAALAEQFGGGRDVKPVKQELKVALAAVAKAYPDARVEQVRGGLRLMPSKPPVPKLGVSGGGG